MHVFFSHHNKNIASSGLYFTPPQCEARLGDRTISKQNLVLTAEALAEIYEFSYLDSCISPAGRTWDEISSLIQKARILCNILGIFSIRLTFDFRPKVERVPRQVVTVKEAQKRGLKDQGMHEDCWCLNTADFVILV